MCFEPFKCHNLNMATNKAWTYIALAFLIDVAQTPGDWMLTDRFGSVSRHLGWSPVVRREGMPTPAENGVPYSGSLRQLNVSPTYNCQTTIDSSSVSGIFSPETRLAPFTLHFTSPTCKHMCSDLTWAWVLIGAVLDQRGMICCTVMFMSAFCWPEFDMS